MPLRVDLFPEEQRKILIVDDEPSVVNFILGILGKQFPDFKFSSAFNGYEAGFQAAILKPDLIILDIRMPGMDGFEVCRKIRTSPETMWIKILAITAFPEDQRVERILACGANDALIKPFGADDLIPKVLSLIS
jgi:two-component system phosphate regulon response regulator PhoB/two-component system alkaline phosphatase synthesis response regulator PhoP